MAGRSPLEAALRRKPLVRRLVKLFYERSGVEEAVVDLHGLPGPAGCTRHSAEDGGSALVDFEAFTVYIVKGWSALYEPTAHAGPCSYAQWASHSWADVGVVIPHHFAEERVRLYRETVELWLARRALPPHEGISLWDGSIAPLVAGHRPGSQRMSLSKAMATAFKRMGPTILDDIAERHEQSPLAARDVLGEERLAREARGEDAPWIAFLEWFEKIVALKRYLEEAWARSVIPVFVSKTSRSSILLQRGLPDVYYLRLREPVEAFVTEARVVDGFERLRFARHPAERGELHGPFFPEEHGLDSFFREELAVVVFYARLERGGPVLRFDVAARADWVGGSVEEAETLKANVLGYVLSIPHPRGYPLPLQVAHANARVSTEEKGRVLEVLGLSFERPGREVLTI